MVLANESFEYFEQFYIFETAFDKEELMGITGIGKLKPQK